MPSNTVKIDRTTKWGNLYRIGEPWVNDAPEVVALFRLGMTAQNRLVVLSELRGKNLACWCPIGMPCHTDVVLDIANTREAAQTGLL
jgi:hypothetical protein